MMSLFENSVILRYWEYLFPIVILIGLLAYFRSNKSQNTKVNDRQSDRPLYAEEEYVGEIQEVNDYSDELQPALEDKPHIPFKGAKITFPGGVNKFYEMMNDRRSVRKYSKKPVDIEIVKRCIHTAGTGPSGAHTEPWSFCLISDADIKSQIRDIIENEEYQNYAQRMSRQWTTDLRPLKTDHVKEYLTDAPYLILIFKQIYGYKPDGTKKQHYYNEISVAISTGILLCALQAAGLNSLITTPLNCGPALRSLLNRPQNEKLMVLLPVGFASDDCTVPDLQRKNLTDIISVH